MIIDESGNILAYMQQAAQIECNAADYKEKAMREGCRPFMLLKPRMFPEGNKWCALYGENLQDGVCAFGDTPDSASRQFDIEWLNAKCGTSRGT